MTETYKMIASEEWTLRLTCQNKAIASFLARVLQNSKITQTKRVAIAVKGKNVVLSKALEIGEAQEIKSWALETASSFGFQAEADRLKEPARDLSRQG